MLINIFKSAGRLLLESARAAGFFAYDFSDYLVHSVAVNPRHDRERLTALISIHAHSLEKGMSLPKPRAAFGANHILALLTYTDYYLANFGIDDIYSRVQGVLRSYSDFNRDKGIDHIPYRERIEMLLAKEVENPRGGLKLLVKADMEQAIAGVGPEFFLTRSSIRRFIDSPVGLDRIINAVRIAQKAPSVCNRQSGFVYILSKAETIKTALTIQAGANGFSEIVPLLLVITTRTKNFFGPERNQRWVDGGLFAMNLIMGLHSDGLGTCCLNWSKPGTIDRKFKREIDIPRDESIIFLLAVGEIADATVVASSEKRPVSEMFEFR